MNKQIAMLITLGLVLTVGVLTTIYTQHVFAVRCLTGGQCGGGPGDLGGVIGGTSGNPGLTTACGQAAVKANNPNC